MAQHAVVNAGHATLAQRLATSGIDLVPLTEGSYTARPIGAPAERVRAVGGSDRARRPSEHVRRILWIAFAGSLVIAPGLASAQPPRPRSAQGDQWRAVERTARGETPPAELKPDDGVARSTHSLRPPYACTAHAPNRERKAGTPA